MRAKSIVLLLLALGCGLVASIGIVQVMGKTDKGPKTKGPEMSAIFVALEEIAMGDAITEKNVRLEDWPKSKIPEGALSRIGDIQGRRVREKVYKGMPILASQLLGKGEDAGGAMGLIPRGFRAVPVKVDAVSGAASMIRPGDRVDVLVHLTANPAKGITKTCSKIFLQNVRVFAVDDKFFIAPDEQDAKKSITAKTVSLLLTPAQVEMLTAAAEVGTIRIVMRGLGDPEVVATKSFSPSDFTSEASSGDADKEKLPGSEAPKTDQSMLDEFNRFMAGQQAQAPKPAPAAEPAPAAPAAPKETWTIRVIEGTTISDVALEPETAPDGTPAAFTRWRTAGRQSNVPQATAVTPVSAAARPAAETPDQPDSPDSSTDQPDPTDSSDN